MCMAEIVVIVGGDVALAYKRSTPPLLSGTQAKSPAINNLGNKLSLDGALQGSTH